MTERRDVLVVGAGLAGLVTARELRAAGRDVFVVEREAEVGGLCRSIHHGGFTFDLTGHVLHLRTEEVRRLIAELLPEGWVKVARRAAIDVAGARVPYPFQVNLGPLPPDIKKECLVGFWRAQTAPQRPDAASTTFHEWIEGTFGPGIARHFMVPYNRKMWGVDLRQMSAEWTTWSVPVPSVEEVVDGALGISRKAFGYNPEFLYPTRGGIEVLPRALARGLEDAVGRDDLAWVDLENRSAGLASGRVVGYGALVSTMPLPKLVSCCRGLAPELARDASALRHVSVVVFNVGVAGRCPVEEHWIYYPDPELPFYRVGFPSNFSGGVAPSGTYSMYVELSVPEVPADVRSLWPAVRAGLGRAGLLPPGAAIVAEAPVVIPCGYVIYDAHRRAALPRLQAALRGHGVLSTGRYGAWEYGSMETAIAQGLAAARELTA